MLEENKFQKMKQELLIATLKMSKLHNLNKINHKTREIAFMVLHHHTLATLHKLQLLLQQVQLRLLNKRLLKLVFQIM